MMDDGDDETDEWGRSADRRHHDQRLQWEYEVIDERLQWDLVSTDIDGTSTYKVWYFDERYQKVQETLRKIYVLSSLEEDVRIGRIERYCTIWNFVRKSIKENGYK